jgi:hypothetical protein
MNINGLFQFMSSEQGNSFFCDVTPENSTEFLGQLMQNEEFTTLAREYVADDSVLRQKIVTKIGQLCKKMKKPKEEDAVPLPVKPTKLVDGYELIKVQYDIDDNNNNEAYLRENSVEDTINVPDEPINEYLGKHIGEGIYLLQEGHVIKMTTPQFVVYY